MHQCIRTESEVAEEPLALDPYLGMHAGAVVGPPGIRDGRQSGGNLEPEWRLTRKRRGDADTAKECRRE
jgi:hypothetical protein